MCAEKFPARKGKILAEGGGAGAIRGVAGLDKVEGPLEEEGGIGEGNGIGPGNVFGGVGRGGGVKFDAFVVVNNAVTSGGVSMPERPPTTVVFWECAVSGGGGEEMAIVDTRFWCIRM